MAHLKSRDRQIAGMGQENELSQWVLAERYLATELERAYVAHLGVDAAAAGRSHGVPGPVSTQRSAEGL